MLAKVVTATNVAGYDMVLTGVIVTEMVQGVAIMEILEIQRMVSGSIVGQMYHRTHLAVLALQETLVLALIVHLYVKQCLYS